MLDDHLLTEERKKTPTTGNSPPIPWNIDALLMTKASLKSIVRCDRLWAPFLVTVVFAMPS